MKFCFFGYISCAIKGQTIGGGELQIYLLARALAINGHEVVIIDPYADEDFTTPEGIQLLTVPDWNNGIRGLRFFFNRIPALYKILINQKADYYYVRMRSFIHLIPYLVAKKNGGKFIQAIASDTDVLSAAKRYQYEYKTNFKLSKYLTEYLPNDLVFKYLSQHADIVTLQHTGQRFTSHSSKNNQFIYSNIIDLKSLPVTINPQKEYYIYAGSITMLKGAENLLKLVNMIDESIQIVFVGSTRGKRSQDIYDELSKKKNVILKGQMSHKETIALISKAKALINTSYYEGFPNIYLEAWGTGVPVISLTVNPGDVINKYGLGICCNGDLNRMKACIETNETVKFNQKNLKEYVKEFHDFDTAAERFLQVIKPVVLMYLPIVLAVKKLILNEVVNANFL